MKLAGYSTLINRYNLEVPLPEFISAISQSHRQYEEDRCAVFSIRYESDHTLLGHLMFALRYEGVEKTVKSILPDEVQYLERHDQMRTFNHDIKDEPTTKELKVDIIQQSYLKDNIRDLA